MESRHRVQGKAGGDALRFRLAGRVAAGPDLKQPGRPLPARPWHPRYVAVLLGLVAVALFSNYLALYLLLPIGAAGLYVIVRLEERELVERFGDEYETYRDRVPMFVPRRGSALE